MKRWQIVLGLGLIGLAALTYVLHYAIFRDPFFLSRLLLAQLAFLPISVLLVTVVLNQLLVRRQRNTLLQKLNMVIGTFFTELGTNLLKYFSEFDHNADTVRKALIVTDRWSQQEFAEVAVRLKGMDHKEGQSGCAEGPLNRKEEFFPATTGKSCPAGT